MVTKKYLHIIAADEKFFLSIRNAFEDVFPGASEYWVFCKSEGVRVPAGFQKFGTKKSDLEKCTKEAGNFEILFVHCLTFPAAKVALGVPDSCRVVWRLWGTDYCNRKEFQFGREFLGPRTSALEAQRSRSWRERLVTNRIVSPISDFYFYCKYGTSPRKAIDEFVRRVEYIAPVVPGEVELLRSRLKLNPEMKGVAFEYGSVESIRANVGDSIAEGGDVLLGNSAAFTNNHFEAFDLLADVNFEGRSLVVPLSYGNPDCRMAVVREGELLFGKSFQPLTQFLPYAEYSRLLKRCSVVVMNHYRQQAVGNVCLALWLGAKVFLSERSPVFQYLKGEGFVVYAIEQDLGALRSSDIVPLDSEKVATNRELLEKHYDKDAKLKQIQESVAQILGV